VPKTKPAKVEVAVVFNLEAERPLVIEVVALPVTVNTPVEREVVVALVEVELRAVKFCRVDDPVANILAAVKRAEKVLLPEKVLLFESKVEEAAVMVMFAVPSKEVPLMVLGVCKALAVPALPEILPVMVLEKVLLPEKVLLFESKVEEAAVMVMLPVPSNDTPLIVLAVSRAVAVSALPINRPVNTPVMLPKVAVVAKRLVDEAVVLKKLVVVAEVPVALMKVKFCKVEEEVERS
jgi:hypothetical protein